MLEEMDAEELQGTSSQIYGKEWCRKHVKARPNLLNFLEHREMELRKPGTQFLSGGRDYYNYIKSIEQSGFEAVTTVTPIRYTPDGSKMIGLDGGKQELVCYRYNGVGNIRNKRKPTWEDLYTKLWTLKVRQLETGATAVRDIILFPNDMDHVVFAYYILKPDNAIILSEIQRNNESEAPVGPLAITNYAVADMETGKLKHLLRYYFEHQNSLSIYHVDRIFGILSIQHQTIMILRLQKDGKLARLREVGRMVYDDCRFFVKDKVPAHTETCLMSFRQKFLTFLYDQHVRLGTSHEFLQYFQYYRTLRMSKFQFLGPETLLIRMEKSLKGAIGGDQELYARRANRNEATISHFMHVIYEWREPKILACYNRTSEKLYNMMIERYEQFRFGNIVDNYFPTTLEHCNHLRRKQDQIVEQCTSTDRGDKTKAYNQFIRDLPMAIQTNYCQPIIADPFYFSYENRVTLIIDRIRCSPDMNIKIVNRRTGDRIVDIEFAQLPLQPYKLNPPVLRCLFHPIEPIATITERFATESNVVVITLPPDQTE
ncbi:unnamed protein product [Bursaphelenchus okinawaensis]|uniref:Uncharacterized protein n=1 Tax=Bursaphelenchus okinawaensis TaxID=465554 RepID=A0A811JQF5_9BILA|nr:unnamed protein product [Bursaphelenchus okinawaensis]CAG9077502.1 unnamed protein product [Bursaphelenchus okinawaensis]